MKVVLKAKKKAKLLPPAKAKAFKGKESNAERYPQVTHLTMAKDTEALKVA